MNSPYLWIRDLFRKPRVRTFRRQPRRLQFEILEDRCLPSAFIPMLPDSGTVQAQGLSAVLYSPALPPTLGADPNLPAAKLVTIMNNDSNVIFPILYSANSTADKTGGTVVNVVLDPNNQGLGYSPGTTATISDLTNPGNTTATAKVKVAGDGSLFGLELVNGGAGYGVNDVLSVSFSGTFTTQAKATASVSNITPAQNGTVSIYDPNDALNNTYRGYIGETVNGHFQLGLQPRAYALNFACITGRIQ